MKTKIVFIFLISTIIQGCISRSKTDIHSIKWEEVGYNAETEIKQGIPASSGSSIDYKRNGKSILRVKLKEPVVVDVAKKPEKWGYYQFPNIARSQDKQLVATWSLAEDAVASYGRGENGIKVSSDGGKTWNTTGQGSIYGGIELPNGDRIAIYTPAALKESEVQLPEPVNNDNDSYGKLYKYYKVDELPDMLQGIYINRVKQGDNKWTREHAALVDSRVIRYSASGLLPVVWWGDLNIARDNSVIVGIYPALYENSDGTVDPSGVSFYRSTDNGHSWKIQGRIPYQPDLKVDPKGYKRFVFGFTEPGFKILADGTCLCVMRTSGGNGNRPMYITRSADEGITWKKPEPFTPAGVLPRLLQLGNGVLVLSSGRPGVQLRFSTDGKGEKWTDPFEMLPFENEKEAVSCGYTELLATGSDRFLVIYSDFKYRNEKNEIRKAIKVREVIVTPK